MLPIYHATRPSPREKQWNLKRISLQNSTRPELQTNTFSFCQHDVSNLQLLNQKKAKIFFFKMNRGGYSEWGSVW